MRIRARFCVYALCRRPPTIIALALVLSAGAPQRPRPHQPAPGRGRTRSAAQDSITLTLSRGRATVALGAEATPVSRPSRRAFGTAGCASRCPACLGSPSTGDCAVLASSVPSGRGRCAGRSGSGAARPADCLPAGSTTWPAGRLRRRRRAAARPRDGRGPRSLPERATFRHRLRLRQESAHSRQRELRRRRAQRSRPVVPLASAPGSSRCASAAGGTRSQGH